MVFTNEYNPLHMMSSHRRAFRLSQLTLSQLSARVKCTLYTSKILQCNIFILGVELSACLVMQIARSAPAVLPVPVFWAPIGVLIVSTQQEPVAVLESNVLGAHQEIGKGR